MNKTQKTRSVPNNVTTLQRLFKKSLKKYNPPKVNNDFARNHVHGLFLYALFRVRENPVLDRTEIRMILEEANNKMWTTMTKRRPRASTHFPDIAYGGAA